MFFDDDNNDGDELDDIVPADIPSLSLPRKAWERAMKRILTRGLPDVEAILGEKKPGNLEFDLIGPAIDDIHLEFDRYEQTTTIRRFLIKENYRGQGFCRATVGRIAEFTRAAGGRFIDLFAQDDGSHLWPRAGWRAKDMNAGKFDRDVGVIIENRYRDLSNAQPDLRSRKIKHALPLRTMEDLWTIVDAAAPVPRKLALKFNAKAVRPWAKTEMLGRVLAAYTRIDCTFDLDGPAAPLKRFAAFTGMELP